MVARTSLDDVSQSVSRIIKSTDTNISADDRRAISAIDTFQLLLLKILSRNIQRFFYEYTGYPIIRAP